MFVQLLNNRDAIKTNSGKKKTANRHLRHRFDRLSVFN